MDFCCKCYMCSLTVLGLFWYCHVVYKQSLILHATAAHANQKGNGRQTCQQSVLSPIQRRSLHQNLMHSWCHGTVALKVCLQGLPFFPFPNFPLDRRPVHRVRLSKILAKQNKTKKFSYMYNFKKNSRLFPGVEICGANVKPFSRIQDPVRMLPSWWV